MRVKSKLLRIFIVPLVMATVTTAGIVSFAGTAYAGNVPVINSITPDSGPAGTIIDINGSHLVPGGNAPTVIFGGTGAVTGPAPNTAPTGGCAATPTSWNDHDVVLAVPAGCSGTVNVYLQTSQGAVLVTNGYTYAPFGPAAKLAFITQPSTTTAGATISLPPIVAVEDALGNVVLSDNTDTITLALSGGNP